MKRPGFFHGVIVAAVLGFFASAIVATLTPFVGPGTVVRLVIPLLGLAYLLYLLNRSAERLGRVTTLTCWTAMTAVAWWAAPPLPLYLLIHVGAVWLIRSLYFYSGVLPALDGSGPGRIERLGSSLGNQPIRQRIPGHLVFFPGAGAVCRDPAGVSAAQSDAETKHPCPQQELRTCQTPSRCGTPPIV